MHLLILGVAIGLVLGHLLTRYWPEIVRSTTSLRPTHEVTKHSKED